MVEWRPVVGWEEWYQVSDDGRVWSNISGREMGLHSNNLGRVQVRLSRPEKFKQLHHLVLEAFVGPCPEGLIGCHYDDDQSNNRLENLRWDTWKANAADAKRNGTKWPGSKTHCKNGHEFSDENTRRLKNGHRVCKECGSQAGKRYRKRLKEMEETKTNGIS